MKKLLLIAIMLGTGGMAAVAATLCTNVVHTAADFTALGNRGCQFDDKVFYAFTYDYTMEDSSGNLVPSSVPASAVVVQFSNLNNSPFLPVVSFISNWDVINGAQGDVRINYKVAAPVAQAMTASSLTLSGFVSNVDPDNQFPSYISGADPICCPGPGNSVVPLGAELDAPLTPSGLVFATAFAQQGYAPATEISIAKDIFLSAGSDSGVPGGPPNGNEAILTRIDEGITELPEPLSFLLLGSGLISIGFLSKRIVKLNR